MLNTIDELLKFPVLLHRNDNEQCCSWDTVYLSHLSFSCAMAMSLVLFTPCFLYELEKSLRLVRGFKKHRIVEQ